MIYNLRLEGEMGKKSARIWPFAAASVAMMLLPSAITQRARLTALGAAGPARRLATVAADFASRLRSPDADDELRRQNEFLRSQVVALHARNGELAAKLEAATAARASLPDADFDLLAADVLVNLDSSAWRQTLVVRRGTSDGVAPGMLVLYHCHVVGRVAEAGPWHSRITLTTDPAFRAGAISIPRTEEADLAVAPRNIGIFEGTGTERGLLKWLQGETPIEDGAYVVTSDDPANGVPKGLILGRVTGIDRGRGAYPRVDVTPIVNPLGLEFVLILVPKR
jgi:rod shape-determining protein MreC